MKRFYSDVNVTPAPGGFQVTLDGRGIKTAKGAAQIAPSRPLADAMAKEWAQQGEEIEPGRFILRDLADYAVDIVAPERAATQAGILAFGESDTLCYRADPGDALFERQSELWEPLLSETEQRHDIRFERISGIIHRPQPADTLAALQRHLGAQDDFTLAALQTCTSLAASLIIGLAAIAPDADAEGLFTLSNLEEDWQAELWGWDSEAEKARATRRDAFCHAVHFAKLARQTG
ncbi:molecular chaperone [Altericroceibacterium spongiae]|uniref:Molecular chaperone n=1 Tax=Altericroceibacterium spongiae TaxID=2320269 RepID=A0A420EK79_9SPHN|nr:ATP12 family protein [Altericroceibacterium spongiae]RKF21099.1 molecular chaperone [Altericroceibacterium spongiae]